MNASLNGATGEPRASHDPIADPIHPYSARVVDIGGSAVPRGFGSPLTPGRRPPRRREKKKPYSVRIVTL